MVSNLKEKLSSYSKRVKEIYLPYLWNNWGVEPEEFSKTIAEMPDVFANWKMVNNLFTDLKALNINSPQWYEYCDTKYKRGSYVHKNQLYETMVKNQIPDQHVSVFAHDDKWVENFKKNNTVSCRETMVGTDWIYLELDRESIKKALEDTNHILFNFPYTDRLRIYYSGNRSVHIAVHASLFGYPIGKQENITGAGRLIYNLAHKIAGDCRHNNGVIDPWLMPRDMLNEEYEKISSEQIDEPKKRQALENIDPNLFRVNSLIRSPYSIHEKTGKQKILLSIDDLTDFTKKEPKKLDFYGNFPYLIHWVYECYEPVIKPVKFEQANIGEGIIIETFSKHIENFDASNANANGFVNKLYSPFYRDGNPSVAVNIQTGYYKDFGNPLDNFDFFEFYARVNGITKTEAKEKLNETH